MKMKWNGKGGEENRKEKQPLKRGAWWWEGEAGYCSLLLGMVVHAHGLACCLGCLLVLVLHRSDVIHINERVLFPRPLCLGLPVAAFVLKHPSLGVDGVWLLLKPRRLPPVTPQKIGGGGMLDLLVLLVR